MTKPRRKPKPVQNNRVFFEHVIVFLFLFFLPTQLGKHFFWDFSYVAAIRIDYLAPTLFLTDILAVILIALNVKNIIPLFKNKFFLIFTGLMILNIATSLSQHLTLYKSLKMLELIFLFMVFYKKIITTRLIIVAFLSEGVIQLILSMLQFFYKHALQGPFYFLGERMLSLNTPGVAKASYEGIEILRPYGSFSHPNSMAGFYLLLHAFVLTYKPFNAYPVLKYAFLGVSAMLVFISFSKVAILGFFLITLIYTLTHTKEINCTFCIISRILVAIVLAFIFAQAHGDPLSGQKRVDLVKNSWEIIKNHTFTGVGIGNYLIAQSKFVMKTSYFSLQPVHNIFLLFMAETGVILSGYLLFLSWKMKKLLVDNLCLAYCIGIITFTGMFDHYWLTLQQNLLLSTTLIAFSIKNDDIIALHDKKSSPRK